MKKSPFILALNLFLGAQPIFAQEKVVTVNPESELVSGWDRALRVSTNANLVNNSNVIGKADGLLTTLGFGLESGLTYAQNQHEWRNTLNYKLSFTRDPVVKEFTKPTDLLTFDTIYLYHIPDLEWVGPFGRFAAEAPLFKGFDVQPSSKNYSIARKNGTTDIRTGKSLDLTDPFKPLTLKESIGVFLKPYSHPFADVEIRFGLGARQTFSDSQLVVRDDAATTAVDVEELRNAYQLGSEAFAQVGGNMATNISYKLYAEVLTPFYTNKPSTDNRSNWNLTNYDFGTNLNVSLASWATLTHEFKALKQPQLLDKFQYSTALLLNIGLEIFRPRGRI